MTTCPTCGQNVTDVAVVHPLTEHERNLLSVWWMTRSTAATARFFGLSEQTVKNELYRARKRNGVRRTMILALLFMGQLRSVEDIAASHNPDRTEAA